MTAVPSAPPSAGSVPAPTSSSSTSAGSARPRSIDTTLVMCAENVLRLAEIDCSSPMSAKRLLKTGSLVPLSAGRCSPACAIAANSPAVFSATVLPPVLGPAMISTRVGGVISTSTATGSVCVRVAGASSSASSRARTADISSGWRAAAQLERAVGRDERLDAAGHLREARPGLDGVELGGHLERALEIVGPRAEGVGELEQDAVDLGGLLLFELDDVVVDLDGAERLEEQALPAGRRAVHDARESIRGARRAPSARSGRCGR